MGGEGGRGGASRIFQNGGNLVARTLVPLQNNYNCIPRLLCVLRPDQFRIIRVIISRWRRKENETLGMDKNVKPNKKLTDGWRRDWLAKPKHPNEPTHG